MKNHVRDLRKEKQWTQDDLAKKLLVSRQTVNAIENGKFDPSIVTAFKIAEIFGQSIESIFVFRDDAE